jgi:hypothetical protein
MNIRTLNRRYTLLQEQHADLVEHPEDNDRAIEYAVAWTSLLFDVLMFLGKDDPEYVEGLEAVRLMFFEGMRRRFSGAPKVILWTPILVYWLTCAMVPEPAVYDVLKLLHQEFDDQWVQEVTA